jgi:hypothetical protein
MAHRTIVVDSLAYEFAPDDPPALADRLWSLLQGRAIDEITGEPVSALEASVAEPELGVRAGEGGTYTVFARPWHRFPPLAAAGYPVHLTIAADGYIATTQVVTVPSHQRLLAAPSPAIGTNVITLSSNAGLVTGQQLLIGPAGPNQESLTITSVGPGANQVTLAAAIVNPHGVGAAVVPDEFAPVVVSDILMHRAPVTIGGRSVRRNASGIGTTPVANASIVVQGIWRTAQDVRQHLPAATAATVSLAPGLYAARTIGAALAAQDLPAIVGDDKFLVDQASSGDSSVGISDRLALVVPPSPPPHSVLRIDAGNPETAEYIGLAGASGPGGVNEPGRAALDHALRMPHRRHALVELVAPQSTAAPKFFADAGAPGDTCVFLSDTAGLDTAATVAISGGTAAPEYQRVRTFVAVSDADGYFQLPPVSRIAQIRLEASAPALPAVTIEFQPDYSRRGNWLDIVFP